MMNERRPSKVMILIADDDEDDYKLLTEGIEEYCINFELRRVKDGAELLDYLFRHGKYADPASSPRPHILFLDLVMPGISGLEALAEIRFEPSLERLPVVVLSGTPNPDELVKESGYDVAGIMRKPFGYDQVINLKSICLKNGIQLKASVDV